MNIVMANTTYKVVVNDREYSISIPSNAPMGEAYDVVFKFLSLINTNIATSTQNVERKEEKPVEESEKK